MSADDLFIDDHLPDGVLVVVAHPDDIDFGVAGTVARLTDAGVAVTYCLVTSGEAGEADGVARHEVGELREREQRAAAKEVGVDDVRILGVPDGRVVADLDLRCRISRIIREVRPELVITQSSERRYDRIYASHPDHLATGEATICAVYPDARNPYAFPELVEEGYEPHKVARTWIMGHPGADRFVDITEVLDRKVAALRAHESQTGWFDAHQLLSDWGRQVAQAGGLPDGRLAEAFVEVNTA